MIFLRSFGPRDHPDRTRTLSVLVVRSPQYLVYRCSRELFAALRALRAGALPGRNLGLHLRNLPEFAIRYTGQVGFFGWLYEYLAGDQQSHPLPA